MKRINILTRYENVTIDFDKDDLPLMQRRDGNEEVKLELPETVAKRAKLNP